MSVAERGDTGMAGTGLHGQERLVDGQHVSGTEMIIGAGDDLSVACDEQSERPVLDLAGAVARQRVLQHRGELRLRVEHDRNAADRLWPLRHPNRRPIDVGWAGLVERTWDERGHRIT